MSTNLKAVILAAVIAVAPLSAAYAGNLSTQKATVGDLFANPAAKAIVEKQFPGISSDPRMFLAKGMTFRQLHDKSPDKITTDKLDIIDAELAKLP
jgi:para-nitrobenzyl esterase